MEKVLEIIAQIQLNKGMAATEKILASSRLREDLDFDSFDLAELTVRVQDAFGVDIFEENPPTTLGDIVAKLR